MAAGVTTTGPDPSCRRNWTSASNDRQPAILARPDYLFYSVGHRPVSLASLAGLLVDPV